MLKDSFIKVIENSQEIKEAEYQFRDILKNNADENIDEIYWSNDMGYGYKYTNFDSYNRYFNGFGIIKPGDNIKMNVFCEINVEKDGINKNTAGAFAKDSKGDIYIIHRGNIAGTDKTEFFNKYYGETAQIQDGNSISDAIIIGSLKDPKLPEHVRNFVFDVAKIKGLVGNNLYSVLKYTNSISNKPNLHDGSYELVNKTVEFISKVNPSKINVKDMDLLYLMSVGTWKCGWNCKKSRIENSNLTEDDKMSLIKVLNSVHGKLENGEYNNSQDHVGMFGTGFMTFEGKMNDDDARKFLSLCVELQKTHEDEVMYKEAEKVLSGGIKYLSVGSVSQILHCLKPFTFPIINGAMNKGTTVYAKLGIELKKPVSESNYIENSKRIKKFKDTNYGFIKNYRAFDLLNFDLYTKNYINKSKNVWLLSPGENAVYWDEFRKNNIITIGWGKLGDLTQFGGDKEKILNALEKTYPKKREAYHAPDSNKTSKQTNNAKALLDFSKEMNIGDIVFIKKGTTKLLGIGLICSDYKFSKETKIYTEFKKTTDHNHFREVEWLKCGEFDATSEGKMIQKTLTNITSYPSKAFEGLLYYQALGKLMDFPVDKYINAPIKSEGNGEDIKYNKEDFLQEVVFLEKNYNQLVNLIKRKKNIILQGPPGVGKSFIAKKLAYSIMGCKDETRVEFIQFHQSYSYEDFIQGFRPVEDGFNLKNGVFYSFCRKAQDDQNNDYYFIIDEINRGNISKIFGELMMLIEEDKRGKEFAIHLTYSDTYSDKDEPKFFIPNNVYVIGMMNTADRSLAMIDYALRRRFVFYSVNPLFEEEDLFKNHLINIGLEEELAKKIISRFKTLNQKISEDDSLGDGFKIGHSYFCGQGHVNDDHESENYEDWYNSIINYEIAPLLKEYWFDNLETAQEEIDKLKIN